MENDLTLKMKYEGSLDDLEETFFQFAEESGETVEDLMINHSLIIGIRENERSYIDSITKRAKSLGYHVVSVDRDLYNQINFEGNDPILDRVIHTLIVYTEPKVNMSVA